MNFRVNDCELCFMDNRYVTEGYNDFEQRILDSCTFGCDDKRSVPTEKSMIENMRISDCDYCNKDNRYVKEGYDSFGVHVVDICGFGCEDKRSVPTKEINIISLPYNPIKHIQTDEEGKRALQILEKTFDELFGEEEIVEPSSNNSPID